MSHAEDVECVVLTGGHSRRMGADKAAVCIEGMRADATLCSRLLANGYSVTVLGRSPVPGCAFLADEEEYRGPAAALARFVPTQPYVFVLACDVYRFDPAFIAFARQAIGGYEAAAPLVDGVPQPLCALYVAEAIGTLCALVASGNMRMRRWLESLRVRVLQADDLTVVGLDPGCVRGANTPEEFRNLMGYDAEEAKHP